MPYIINGKSLTVISHIGRSSIIEVQLARQPHKLLFLLLLRQTKAVRQVQGHGFRHA